jgi:NAD(P)-dependent dehydrogenase (short-subunit alcohol dehydrogenase family)
MGIMRGLAGKSAVVIGGASGIGAATAARLAQEGARVLIGDIDLQGATNVAEEIVANGGTCRAQACDMSSQHDLKALFSTAVSAHDGLHVLHNNAVDTRSVRAEWNRGVADVDLDVWDETMRINLRGYMLACREAVPIMTAQGGGAIVNTSSVVSFAPLPMQASYATSKGAINSLTLSVAVTYGRHGIRCNAVCPGHIQTKAVRTARIYDENTLRSQAVTPSNKSGAPEDIAALVAFLASDDALFLNGQVITVDGGMTTPAPFYASLLEAAAS